MQDYISILILSVAVGFLLWKYVVKKLASSSDKNCGPDCNCS